MKEAQKGLDKLIKKRCIDYIDKLRVDAWKELMD